MNFGEKSQGVARRLRQYIADNYKGKWTVFAKKCGVVSGSIKPWLDGKSLPSGKHLINMAEAGVPIEWLLTGKEPELNGEPEVLLPQVRRAHRPLDLTSPSKEIAETVGMAWSVLESDTSTAQALELNVNEFYEKVFGAKPGKKRGNG